MISLSRDDVDLTRWGWPRLPTRDTRGDVDRGDVGGVGVGISSPLAWSWWFVGKHGGAATTQQQLVYRLG